MLVTDTMSVSCSVSLHCQQAAGEINSQRACEEFTIQYYGDILNDSTTFWMWDLLSRGNGGEMDF